MRLSAAREAVSIRREPGDCVCRTAGQWPMIPNLTRRAAFWHLQSLHVGSLRCMKSRFALVVVLMCLLASCGGSSDKKEQAAGSDGGARNADSGSVGGDPTATIVDSGFAQGQYTTQAMVVVTTDSEAAIGEFVTVSVNFLDEAGQILATAEQVESFKWVGQEIAMPVTPTDLGKGAKVTSIDPSVSLSDYGTTEESKAPLPVLESTEVRRAEFGGFVASFALTNETSEDLKSPRVGVVCYNAGGKIIGGTSTYPDLVPSGKTIRIDAEPTVSGKPENCKAFVSYDV